MSFRPVGDEDPAEGRADGASDAPDAFDAFDAFGTKGRRKPARGGRSAPAEPPAPKTSPTSEEAAASEAAEAAISAEVAADEPSADPDAPPSTEPAATTDPATTDPATAVPVASDERADEADPGAPVDSADVSDALEPGKPAVASGEPADEADPVASGDAPTTAAPDTTALGTTALGTTALGTADLGTAGPGAADPGTAGPEAAAPGTADHEAEASELGTAGPGTGNPDAPEADTADPAEPKPAAPPHEAPAGDPASKESADGTTGAAPAEGGEPEEAGEPEAERPSLFVKPAALGGPGARKKAAGAAPSAEGPSDAQDEGEQPGGEAVPGHPKVEEDLPAEAAETLQSALDTLREAVADLRFGLDLPGVEEARQAQADLLAQLEGYVLPRVRTSAAPALIVIAGSTGAGKSTLVNTLAEKNVSRTGVRRPTTGTPVLVCHPDDRKWFAEGDLLGGLERVDQPSPEAGLRSMVVVSTEKLPQGVALLDTPDIDSVVEEHHEVAHRMLDAADLWIFVTTAARYADAPAWGLLKLAKERGARLAIVLSRVQPRSAEVVLKHFVRMLTEYGLGEIDRFVVHETKVTEGRLPDSEVTDLRLWLAELSVDEERRAQAVRETLNGVLNSFRTRVPALAKHLEGQVAFRAELRGDVEAAFRGALGEIEKASKNGSLLHGEVLARWQDFAGSGDLMRSLQLRKRGRAAKQAPERVLAFKAAIRAGLESVIVAAANRASEEVVARWRHRSELGAELGDGLDRPSDNLVRHTGRAIASWQEHLGDLVRTDGVAKRSVSKLVSFDPDSLALIFTVAMFSGNGEGVPHRLVNALLGAESLRGIGAKALSDLRARIGMLFDEESMRYVQALDSAGIPDESVATRLYQATYNLEVAR
ncbi:dynamin family protein [Nonomuraea phyllanthi]|uniref:dynamin family protein n=1 Tax=Nonomuraea phyllanthi TaxID=2219224 RepID=UPI001D01B3B3|nr:dynamin family protein [Nonomuraea phyllanthi]